MQNQTLNRVIRHLVKKYCPTPFLYQVLKRQKMNKLDLSRIQLIAEKDLDYLNDQKSIEFDLLPSLGLNNENLHEFPTHLYPHCGQGLWHWQYPCQFSRYLLLLSKLKINRYMEIGVRHGGTFIITVEYLNRFNPIEKAYAIDIGLSPSLIEYQELNPHAEFKKADSQLPEFRDFVEAEPRFDLVFIDGDHTEKACRKDFESVKNHANIISFHDIVSHACPGVIKVWNEIKDQYQDEYEFFEFKEQYEEVVRKMGQSYVSMGVAVRKDYLDQSGISIDSLR